MKKARIRKTDHGMRREYDFSRGIRGKYATQFADGANVVVLAADVAEAFPNSAAVNEGLRLLVRLARLSTKQRPPRRARSRR